MCKNIAKVLTNRYNNKDTVFKGKVMDKRKKSSIWYEKHLQRWIPSYALIPLISCFLWNSVIYWGTQFLCSGRHHYDFTNTFDQAVPLQTWWILIYVASFVFWPVCYILTAKYNNREFLFRFVTADLLSRTICGVIFVILPTTNVRPEFPIDGFCDWLLQMIYAVDLPYDLFPSIHCLVSLMCYLGIRKSSQIKPAIKGGILIFALLICASTQFIKQHYIVDVIGGILVALVSFEAGMKTDLYKPVEKIFSRINRAVFG